ncbi:hypothetical protein [Neptunicoccus sediminis]|uniref:hypothetical protein n=1 Tax=Neptunicoccus sediminis TaxID=1892596 RepID=UPI000845E15B|nr:hypothetical protein [Neptunicoccus sediminis]
MPDEVFLVGDSFVIAIAQAAKATGLGYQGGPVSAGRFLEEPFYRIEQDRFEITLEGSGPIRPLFHDLLRSSAPVISTVGFNSHRLAAQFTALYRTQGVAHYSEMMSGDVFAACVLDARAVALEFYRMLADAGRKVFFTCSPQRVPLPELEVLREAETILIDAVSATGAVFLDARPGTANAQGLLPEFALPEDTIHANAGWGQIVLDLWAARQTD